jgi:mono/diheme cytochrome c family protein
MNYPIWDLQGSGLLIAFVAVVHVFVSHFAVGGGLFLVLAEHKARRENDAALLGYVRKHSRFFILLTLVFGAITGVGIWFTITLVNPSATSSLIKTFVWGWAIEWTFFLTEIAAAMIYYYGWDRLSARDHLVVGWIYFAAAFLSLVIINGILTYMLTPGRWLVDHAFWSGFFNPTYWPAVVARTVGGVGLAGLYALFTAAPLEDLELKRKIVRWAGLRWVVPMTILLPVSLVWFFAAAAKAGVPVGEVFGTTGDGFAAVVSAILRGPAATGNPFAQRAAIVGAAATAFACVVTLVIVFAWPTRYGRWVAGPLLLAGLLAIGGAEWVREDLRKPFVIGRFMFVNGVRLPSADSVPRPPAGFEDRFTIAALNESGVLATPWARAPEGWSAVDGMEGEARTRIEAEAGRAIFELECFACHTVDGYNAVRRLVRGQSSGAIAVTLHQLARPVTAAGEPASWNDPNLRLATWKGRRMPPFVGTDAETHALSVYLATLGGGTISPTERSLAGGQQVFADHCSMCHGPDADWPIATRLHDRTRVEWYDLLGRLDTVNSNMPPFEGTDAERQALAEYLTGLETTPEGGAR